MVYSAEARAARVCREMIVARVYGGSEVVEPSAHIRRICLGQGDGLPARQGLPGWFGAHRHFTPQIAYDGLLKAPDRSNAPGNVSVSVRYRAAGRNCLTVRTSHAV